jgi:hypothetical protein
MTGPLLALAVMLYCGEPYAVFGWDLTTTPPVTPILVATDSLEKGSPLDRLLGEVHARAKVAGTLEYAEIIRPEDRPLTCAEKTKS